MAATKTVPAKPAPKTVPAPKAGPPAPKKAAAAASPPKPAPKPAAAPPKPGAPKAAAAPPPATKQAAPAGGVTKADLDAYKKEVGATLQQMTQAMEAFASRLDGFELALQGLGPFVSTDEAGNIVLDIDNADEESLRNWAWMFGTCDHNADAEAIRSAFSKAVKAKNFSGWQQVQALPRPEGEAAAEESAEEAAEEAEEEEQVITIEQINKMNWSELTPVAQELGIDFSAIKPQNPKILRGLVIEALQALQAEASDEGEAESEEGGLPFEPGTTVNVTIDEDVYEGVFSGIDETDPSAYVIDFGDDNVQSVPADNVSLPG